MDYGCSKPPWLGLGAGAVDTASSAFTLLDCKGIIYLYWLDSIYLKYWLRAPLDWTLHWKHIIYIRSRSLRTPDKTPSHINIHRRILQMGKRVKPKEWTREGEARTVRSMDVNSSSPAINTNPDPYFPRIVMESEAKMPQNIPSNVPQTRPRDKPQGGPRRLRW